MADLSMFKHRNVLVTGHTGFKGAWLCLWLHTLGARVSGLALDPAVEPSLFDVVDIADILHQDHRVDLRHRDAVTKAVQESAPDVVFHLAAQAIVTESFHDPIGTWETNVLGTANLLEALRSVDAVKAIVVATTDKVYENVDGGVYPFRETDPLGGNADPYSASKAATEFVVATYRKNFFTDNNRRIGSVRAGNVIGGGDWSPNRLVPDAIRAFASGKELLLRYPAAVRPWQNVLDPLFGYLIYAQFLLEESQKQDLPVALNFGPDSSSHLSVGATAELLAKHWGGKASISLDGSDHFPEANFLTLDSSLARHSLNWRPRLPVRDAVSWTVQWYQAYHNGHSMMDHSLNDIVSYNELSL